MMLRTVRWLLCLGMLAWLGNLAGATEPTPKGKTPAASTAAAKPAESAAKKDKKDSAKTKGSGESAPATHTVKRGPLKVTVDLEGVFEAANRRRKSSSKPTNGPC